MSADSGFLSRWAQRKSQARSGQALPPGPGDLSAALPSAHGSSARPGGGMAPVAAAVVATPPCTDGAGPVAATPAIPHTEAPPVPTLADVETLAPGEEVSRFVARGVDETVKRAAVRKLFADPHFNIMDGLDIYIDDYGKPDPIPMSMLRQMNQSRALGLFAAEEEAEALAARQSLESQASEAPRLDRGAPGPEAASGRPAAEGTGTQGEPIPATPAPAVEGVPYAGEGEPAPGLQTPPP